MSGRWMIACVAMLVGFTARGGSAVSEPIFTAHYENILGTSLELLVRAPSRAIAARAERTMVAEIARQSRALSTWDPHSEVSQWLRTRDQSVRVSPELFEVLGLFDEWRDRTQGVIDPAAQALITLWTRAAAEHRVPTERERAAALAAVHQRHWTLNRAAHTATHLSDTPLVLASFTKSYIMQKAADRAQTLAGVHGLVLNLGGDVLARGAWAAPIDIANPRDDAENSAPVSTIIVRNRMVATSGDYRRGMTIGGARYSHIIDARTGLPAARAISATVVASNPTDAGALATAFTALSPTESRALAATVPGVEYLLVTPDGARIASPGWPALEVSARAVAGQTSRAPAPPATASAARAGGWDASMELTVGFEIPMQSDGAAKRPFIALWIEDADKFPLRTLALVYHEDRWLTESKAWYRADRLRSLSEATSIVRTIGAATRPTGKYTIKWDGKDNAGNVVKAGTYTVLLECVREHGSYQLVRREMRFTGAPQRIEILPGAELGAVSFDYHKVAN